MANGHVTVHTKQFFIIVIRWDFFSFQYEFSNTHSHIWSIFTHDMHSFGNEGKSIKYENVIVSKMVTIWPTWWPVNWVAVHQDASTPTETNHSLRNCTVQLQNHPKTPLITIWPTMATKNFEFKQQKRRRSQLIFRGKSRCFPSPETAAQRNKFVKKGSEFFRWLHNEKKIKVN